jgi:hypothetical protein
MVYRPVATARNTFILSYFTAFSSIKQFQRGGSAYRGPGAILSLAILSWSKKNRGTPFICNPSTVHDSTAIQATNSPRSTIDPYMQSVYCI